MALHLYLIKRLKNVLNWTLQQKKLWLLLFALILALRAEGFPPATLDTQITNRLTSRQFDFFGWELDALVGKLLQGLAAPQRYMTESDRHDFVLDYLDLVAEIQRLDWEINLTYTDPNVADAEAATAEARARLADLRAEQRVRQPLAEAILEEQVASVLVDEGFGALGQELPPVSAHFTPLPLMLFISPRDRIETIYQFGLQHGLDTAQQEAIEEQIDAEFNVSSLVSNIGGLAAYPSMLLESSWINWVAEVTAHEWTHHYLLTRPLGWRYLSSPEARTINETTASIAGKEIGRLVIARYYPEYLPPEPEPEPPPEEKEEEEETPPPEPPAFDFRLEMRETRVRVDELLAEGKIEEAEAYMEERRQVFVANGYVIRKLNQAYFAFHGSYADAPGAAGEDPIGPAVQALRARSPNLHIFIERVSYATTLADLQALLAQTEE